MKKNRRGKTPMQEKETPYLPHELTIEILLRLPVKSLISFKSVCKSWFSLISHDPHFANSHFQITAGTHTRKIVFITDSLIDTLSLDFESSIHNDTVIERPNPDFINPLSDYLIQIISSCRGFIFLHRDSSFYVWNPSTRVHKQIPLSPNESNLNATDFCYLYGFGYDQLRDDYLVVSVSYDPALVDIYSRLEFFSFRDNTWKELEGNHFPYMSNSGAVPRVGLFFNGAIHWLTLHYDLLKDVILAFDLMERKLLEMPFPVVDHELENCDLWVFGEFLSLWAMDYGNRRVEIWVIKEYKLHSSWTKILVLPIDGFPSRYFSPICSTKCGDIVGTDGESGLLKYNDEGQLLEHESFWFGRLESGFQVIVYTESLLSLPGGNVQA